MIPTALQNLSRILLAVVVGLMALNSPGQAASIVDTNSKQLAVGQVDTNGQLIVTVPAVNESAAQPEKLVVRGGAGESVELPTEDGRVLKASNGCVFELIDGTDATNRADPTQMTAAIEHACDGVKVTVTGTKVMTPTANISITVPVTVTNTTPAPDVTDATPPIIEYRIPGTPYSLKAEYWGHVIALENHSSTAVMGLDERWVVELVSSFEDAWIEGRVIHITYVNPTGQYILYDYTLPGNWPDAVMP
ncbi:MAG: hypothetical protein M1352_02130 [Patescibacteria group bacterium]|nr:hypothetical protein [Patescibacteria group bacterium]